MQLKNILVMSLLIFSISCAKESDSDSSSNPNTNPSGFDLTIVKETITYGEGTNTSTSSDPIDCSSVGYYSSILRSVNKVAFGAITVTCGACSLEVICTPTKSVAIQSYNTSGGSIGSYFPTCGDGGTIILNNSIPTPPEIIKVTADMEDESDIEYLKCL